MDDGGESINVWKQNITSQHSKKIIWHATVAVALTFKNGIIIEIPIYYIVCLQFSFNSYHTVENNLLKCLSQCLLHMWQVLSCLMQIIEYLPHIFILLENASC